MALVQEPRKIKNLRLPSLSLPSISAHHRPLLSLQTIPRQSVTTTFTSSSTAPISSSDLQRLQVLGRGSGGTVYKVLHKPTSTAYALKQLKPAADSSDDKNTLQQSEIDILCRTTGSPFVVNCHAVFENPSGDVSVPMEYMDSGSLETLLKSKGPFSEEELAPVARQVLQGLDFLHNTHKIVHRDIKPANLLMNSMEVKIADFGCSEIMSRDSSEESCSSNVGTYAYMSPERFDPEGHGRCYNGCACDIWSFGVTIMELYMGYFPLLPKGQGPDWVSLMCAICFGEVPSLPEGASDDLRSFVECCMQKEASKRWTAAQLLTHPFICKSRSDDESKQNLQNKKRKHDADDDVEQTERSQKSFKGDLC